MFPVYPDGSIGFLFPAIRDWGEAAIRIRAVVSTLGSPVFANPVNFFLSCRVFFVLLSSEMRPVLKKSWEKSLPYRGKVVLLHPQNRDGDAGFGGFAAVH